MPDTLRQIPIRNQELLALLDRYVKLTQEPEFKQYAHKNCVQEKDNRDWWVGDKYVKGLMDGSIKQDGFPDACYGYDLAIHKEKHMPYERNTPPQAKKHLTSVWGQLRQDIMEFLGAKYHALTAIYPPGGFISWHNNANAPGYNLIITWSENGDGWFDYIDPTTKERVRVQDEPGWQCKAAYFGSFDEPDKMFYHCASTDCWRITVSFVFSMDPLAQEMREELIEEIMTE